MRSLAMLHVMRGLFQKLKGLSARLAILLAVLPVVLVASVSQAEPAATGWRVGERDKGARFVLDLADPVPFNINQRGPQLISIEMPALDWRIKGRGPSGGLIRGVEHRLSEGGRHAIDIRLSRAGHVSSQLLLPPSEGLRYRLVIDIAPGADDSPGTTPSGLSALILPPVSGPTAQPLPPPAPPPTSGRTAQRPGPQPQVPPSSPFPSVSSPYVQPESGPGAPLPEPPAPRPPPAVPRARVQTEVLAPPAPPPAPIPLPPPITEPVAKAEAPPPAPVTVYERVPGYPLRVLMTLPAAKEAAAVPPAPFNAPAEPPKQDQSGAPPESPASQSSGFVEPPPVAPVEQGDIRPLIVLDPGHGGKDPGATSLSGAFEKNLTLAVAVEMKKKLEATGRYRVALTRDGDVAVRLRDRVQLARSAGAGLFVSLHADALSDRSVRGMSVYTLSDKASDKEAEALAAKENKADLIGGMDLSEADPGVTNILLDLARRETRSTSLVFARLLIRELKRDTPTVNNTLRSAGFAVLTAPDMPAVLMEMGYLSNAEDEKLIMSPDHQSKVADGLVRAADIHFAKRN
ncbi:N-acetylmuramoyl-L-alanine amidase [Lacibacterium aquatile]|uniref:N-acetylmuramoyl-L-alanine amidase n=1 Tax=Lacibacterium aquatile TaxID=1168082 RepID=A0ABW5DQ56_9PROT